MMRSEMPPTQAFDSDIAAVGGHPNRARSGSRLAQGQLSPTEPAARELFNPQVADVDVPSLGPISMPATMASPASQQVQQLTQPNQAAQVQQAMPTIQAKELAAAGPMPPWKSSAMATSADGSMATQAVAVPPVPAGTAAPKPTVADQQASAEESSGIAAAESSTSAKSDAKPALLPAPPVGIQSNVTESGDPIANPNKTVPLLTDDKDANISTANSTLSREPAKAVTTRGAIISMLLGLFVTLFFLALVMSMLHLGRKADTPELPEKEPPRPTRSYRQMFKAQRAETAQPTS